MATYEFRKVLCVDPCDPKGIMTRNLALLVQIAPAPTNPKTHMSRPIGWLPEPILINPVRMVDRITKDTFIQKIHVIDRVFGNQLVQYITNQKPVVDFNASNDKKEIVGLWPQSTRTPEYSPGQARANPVYQAGEIKMDGARSDFAASYNDKCPVLGEAPADDIPTYCHCFVRGDDGRRMIQCSNQERYCLKEWYHLECIGMGAKDVPPGDVDWFCHDCVEGRLGKLRTRDYTPWVRPPGNRRTAAKTVAARSDGSPIRPRRKARNARRGNQDVAELAKFEMQFRDAILLSQATGGPIFGRPRSASI